MEGEEEKERTEKGKRGNEEDMGTEEKVWGGWEGGRG